MITALGLKGRAILLCILLVLGTGVAVTIALVLRTYGTSVAALEAESIRQAQGLAYNAEPSILLGDKKALQRIVRTLATDSAVTNAAIYDANGTPLAVYCHRDPKASLACGCDFPLTTLATPLSSKQLKRTSTEIFVTLPVWSGESGIELDLEDAEDREEALATVRPIGMISLTHRLDELYAQTASNVAYSVLVVALVICAGALVTVLSVRQLLRPVQNLVDSTARLAAGELGHRATEDAVGEIGVLSRSFNRMAQALSKHTESLESQVRDRTAELTRSTGALAEKERHLRTLLDSQPECVKTLDRNGRLLEMNPAGLRALGWDSDESVAGASVYDFICPEHVEAFKELNGRVFDGESATLEFEIMTLRGERRWMETSAVPLRDAEGAVLAQLSSTRDITDAKRKVEELRIAKEQAEAGDKAKSEFLANISHEIRTPMNGIIGMTQIALDGELETDQRENLDIVLECSESLLTLINDILDFSKIGAGKLNIESTHLDLASCVGSVVDVVGTAARDKALSLTTDIGEDIPTNLVGDPHRLRQVLTNLVGNAIKFTEHGSVVISAKLEKASEDNATIELCVEDTGIGIPADRLDAVFESFTQADGATTREYGGTGLGLSISKQIVGLMGGKIWVESTLGRGSCFFVRVELARAVAEDDLANTDAEKALNLTEALGRLSGDRSMLLEVIATFAEDLPNMLAEMRAALDSGDAESVRTAARCLQGAASTIGAEAIVRDACELEGGDDDWNWDRARGTFERIERDAKQLYVEASDLDIGSGTGE